MSNKLKNYFVNRINEFIDIAISPIFRYRFFKIIKINSKKNIFVFDIDNTIADTWPTVVSNNSYKKEKERLMSLKVFEGMKTLLLQLMANKNNVVIFLSARSYIHYLTTYYWLKRHLININHSDVIIVRKPSDKIKLLKAAAIAKIHYFDDLSYNQENGEIKFYEEEILAARQIKHLTYIGYNDILLINKNQ